MRMWVDRPVGRDFRTFTVEVTDADLKKVRLDHIDWAILSTPHEGIADVLQDLQILAFRLEQQAKEAS